MKDYDSLHGVYVDDKCFLINLTECYYPPQWQKFRHERYSTLVHVLIHVCPHFKSY